MRDGMDREKKGQCEVVKRWWVLVCAVSAGEDIGVAPGGAGCSSGVCVLVLPKPLASATQAQALHPQPVFTACCLGVCVGGWAGCCVDIRPRRHA